MSVQQPGCNTTCGGVWKWCRATCVWSGLAFCWYDCTAKIWQKHKTVAVLHYVWYSIKTKEHQFLNNLCYLVMSEKSFYTCHFKTNNHYWDYCGTMHKKCEDKKYSSLATGNWVPSTPFRTASLAQYAAHIAMHCWRHYRWGSSLVADLKSHSRAVLEFYHWYNLQWSKFACAHCEIHYVKKLVHLFGVRC